MFVDKLPLVISKQKYSLAMGFIFLISFCWIALAHAQAAGGDWIGPYRLSSEEGIFVHQSNNLIADQYGFAHLFWLERGFRDGRAFVQYARFDGDNWSLPIDIHAAQLGGAQDRLSSSVDHDGNLHLIWTQGLGFRTNPIFYSYAAGQEALSAQNWSKPVRIDVAAHLIKLQVDEKGDLHVVYTDFFAQPGVFYTRSADKGFTWSDPIKLDPDIPPGFAPASLEFELDESGGLHVVWFYTLIEGGEWDLVQYAHSLDGGETWSLPFTIDKDDESGRFRGAVDPVMITEAGSVHVLWAAGEFNYRNYRFSNDAGRTWGDIVRVFGRLNGQAGDSLSVDAAGRMHFFGQLRFPQGVYHVTLENGIWTEPSLIYIIRFSSEDEGLGRIHAHSVVSTIRAGNQMFVTFYDRDDEQSFALYGMHRTLEDLSSIPAKPMPTSTPQPTQTAMLSQNTPVPALENHRYPDISSSVPINTTPAFNLWSGVMPVILFVGGVVIFIKLRNR